MNQYIVGCTQHIAWHTHRKTDIEPHLQLAIKRKQNSTRRDIPRQGSKFGLPGGQDHGKRKGKPHRTAHFLAHA
jgi:hypothetical protein